MNLKNLASLLLLTLFAFLATDLLAATRTVSNNPARPAQHTTIQAAVNAAVAGDTILVTGSATAYTGFTTLKQLVIIGEGINSPLVTVDGGVYFGRLNSSLSSSGSRLYGVKCLSVIHLYPSFSGAQSGQEILNDIIIERCHLASVYLYDVNGTISNITLRNNVMTGGYLFYCTETQISTILLTNNVFGPGYAYTANLNMNGNVILRNNIFLNRATDGFVAAAGLVLENNIFYKYEPTGCTNCTFNNNITYLCNNNTLPPSGSVGSGNIQSADPKFVNYPALGGVDHSFAHDYGLQAGSPAIGTGTNGTNIGLTGGNSPVNNIQQFPKIPAVTQLTIPVSSVPTGGTLQINLKAVTRD